jgi:hypothetical protein
MSHSRRDWDTGRLAVHDRNFNDVSLLWESQGTSPHLKTNRRTYTVPAGKRAIVASAFAFVQRITAPSSGTARLQASISIYTPTETILLIARLFDAAVSAQHDMILAGEVALDEGTQLDIDTVDQSNDGTADYTISARILEFDA